MDEFEQELKKQDKGDTLTKKGLYIFFVSIGLFFCCMYILLHHIAVSSTAVSIINVASIILVPLLLYILYIKPRNARKEYLYIMLIATVALTYWLTPIEQREFLQSLLKWLIPLLEVLVVIYLIYRIYTIVKHYKLVSHNQADAEPMAVMRKALLPMLGDGKLIEIIIAELSVFYYSIVVWFKKSKSYNSGYYTYHKESLIKSIIIVFVVIITIEAVSLHFLISMWSEILAWIALVLNVYAMMYLVALYNSIRYLPMLLDEKRLLVRLGFQSQIEIELHNIAYIQPAKEIALGEKITKDSYIAHLRMDAPQFELALREPIMMKGSFGSRKSISKVIVRVDQPQQFITHLKQLNEQL